MNDELPQLIDEAKAVAEDAEKTFGYLSAQHLNWKPNTDEWSIAQCIAHLMVINASYFPLIRKIARGEYKPSVRDKATAVTWVVGDVDGVVQALTSKGVAFEHYDLPGTTRRGVVHVTGSRKAAWCKDPDGNILAIV